MSPHPPTPSPTDTLFPYTTLFLPEVGHHQLAGELLVGCLTLLNELHTGLDEQRSRTQHPERILSAAVRGQNGRRGRGEVGVVLALVEQRPARAAQIGRAHV